MSITCMPEANPLDGTLVLKERKEDLPLVFSNCIFSLGSTLLYPAIFAITTLAELYIGCDLLLQKYKNWKVDRKIENLTNNIEEFKNKRLDKLNQRKEKLEQAQIFQNTTDSKEEIIQNIKNAYQEARERATATNYSFSSVSIRTECENKLNIVRAYERTDQEIKAYEGKSSEQIQGLFIKRYTFSKLRRELRQKIDLHYMRNLLIAEIPIFGLVYLFNSKYTTKTFLEQTDLVKEYNHTVHQYQWLKPY